MRPVSLFYPDLHNADIAAVLRGMRRSGATIIHTTLSWSVVEPQPGSFDFSAYLSAFKPLADEGFRFIVALDSSGRLITPPGRVIEDETIMARPAWLAGETSYEIFARDFYGNEAADLDVFDSAHLPFLQRFYDEALNFLQAKLGKRVFAVLPAITMELEIKFGQVNFCWRSYTDCARQRFAEFLGVPPDAPQPQLPVSDFNNSLSEHLPRHQPQFSAMMRFREIGLIDYLRPLCEKIHSFGFETIAYFGEFFSFFDAIYATGVVERASELFDIACFDYNYYNGTKQTRDPWIVPALVNFGRNLGYRKTQIGLYVERYRNFATNQFDTSILQTVRDTLEHIDDGADVIGLEIGGIEADDLGVIRSFNISSARGFDLGGDLPKKESGAIRIAVLASFDTHYLWHGDFSCDRDHLHDVIIETYRILRLSRDFDVSIVSARRVEEARRPLQEFDAVFLPHVLAMSGELIDRLVAAKEAGIKVIQDVGAGNFTPDGEPRNLHRLFDLFGLTGMSWQTGAGRFRHGDTEIEIKLPDGQQYFTYVRMAISKEGIIRLPELGQEGTGLIAESGNALSFGFLPQLCNCAPGKLFWETMFLHTIENFVRTSEFLATASPGGEDSGGQLPNNRY